MKGLKTFSFALMPLVLLTFIVSANAQENDPSMQMRIADEFKNDYNFEFALEWYEKVITDFPNTLYAGNATLNKLAILYSQISWYTKLSSEFLLLVNAQYSEASAYSCRSSAWKKYKEFFEKKKNYERLKLQKGKDLREEFFRFEKNYASQINRLSIPHINEYKGRMPSVTSIKEEDIGKILVLGKDSSLEYESRRKYDLTFNFRVFSLQYMMLGGETPTKEDMSAYHNKEYSEDKINLIGFYYCLGLGLENSYQFKTACEAYKRVINLSKDELGNKLAYDAEKRIKNLADSSSAIIDDFKKYFSQDEIDEYIKPYIVGEIRWK